MKWADMTTLQKLLHALSLICIFLYFVVLVLELFGLLSLSPSMRSPILILFCLAQGFLNKGKKTSVFFYILAGISALTFLLNLLLLR